MIYSEAIKNCRLCNSDKLDQVFNFGNVALANNYLTKEQLEKIQNGEEEEIKTPLNYSLCRECGSLQIDNTVNPDLLFKNYSYATGAGSNLKTHFRKYAEEVLEKLKRFKIKKVLVIGSNDGTELKIWNDLGCDVLGVDPAENLTEFSIEDGYKTYQGFFNEATAKKILKKYGKFDLIVSNNCLAHIPDLNDILRGINIVLESSGFLVFENAYLYDTLKGFYFDQCYGEHCFLHSIKPIQNLLEKNGLSLIDLTFNQNQGGSFRVFASASFRSDVKPSDIVEKTIQKEVKEGLYDLKTYSNFIAELNRKRSFLKGVIDGYNGQNLRVGGFGSPAKAVLFLKFMGLNKKDIKFIVDDSPLKQNLFLPHHHIPIKNSSWLEKMDVCLILAWNFADYIIEKNKNFKGVFIKPLPEVKVIEPS